MSDVEIELDGKTVTLKPKLQAAKLVCRAGGGGFQPVVNRLQVGDIDIYSLVVAAGLNKPVKDVEEAVFRTGLTALAPHLIEFVNLLANGGRPYRPKKLKTVEIDGKTYAEVENGEPVYVDNDTAAAGGEPAGEG